MTKVILQEHFMLKRWILPAVWLAIAATGWASDQVKTTAKEKSLLFGQVTAVSPQAVTFQPTGEGSQAREIPVNEIVSIKFESEPLPLLRAREKMGEGEYGEASSALERISTEGVKRREILDEIAFSKAYCAAQLALAGDGNVADAGRQMVAFIKESPESYHYLQACELVGNLLASSGALDKAQEYYAILAKAPWPDYKMRAQIAIGRALLAQDKTVEAAKVFDEVIDSPATGDLAERQRMAAKVGKARCLAAAGQTAPAIKSLREIIDKADSDNVELHALAYNALGTALRKDGKPKEAVLAFLHVDLLYSSVQEAHAEALANLEQLFEQIHKPDYARRARQELDQRYKNSRWASGVK
jgi:tetratricopeptide (TPR) repeat protein